MGRRRRSRPKNPRRGPGHNEQNKQTRESRQRQKMLDGGQEARFRYFMELILEEQGLEPEEARPLIQALWTQGHRNTTEEAKAYLAGKAAEGVIGDGAQNEIVRLIDKYSRWR